MDGIIESLGLACDRLKMIPSQKAELHKAVEKAVAALVDENARMRGILDEAALLVKAAGHDRIIHDLRNILNELVLLKALGEQDEDLRKT